MATRHKSRFWRVCRIGFRRFRIAVWLVIMVVLGVLLYVNQVGLPDVMKKALLEKLRSHGLDLQFSRLRWRWYQGIVAENVRFGRSEEPFSPHLTLAEVQVRLNPKALSRFQLQVDSVKLHQGRLSWPLPQTNGLPKELSLQKIETELHFLPDDQWALDDFKAAFAGVNIRLSGSVRNASAVREWKLFQAQPAGWVQSGNWHSRLSGFVDTLAGIRFSVQPDLRLDIRGDARDLQSFRVLLLVAAPAAETPWGMLSEGQLTGRVFPADTNGLSRAELRLEAADAQTRWANITNFSLRLRLVCGEWRTNLVHGELELSAKEARTPWCTGSNALFTAHWVHSTTNPVPLSGESKFACEHPQTRWGDARRIELQARLATPLGASVRGRADPSWGWWTNLQPYSLDWDCRLVDLLSPQLIAGQISCGGTWLAPQLMITNLSAKLYEGHIAARGEVDVATRELHLNVTSDFDPRRTTTLLTEPGRRWLDQFSWAKAPKIKGDLYLVLPAWTNQQPDWRAEVQPTLRIQGEFNLDGNGAYRQIEVTGAHSHFIYSNLCWDLPDLRVTWLEGDLEAVHHADERCKEFYWRVSSKANPNILGPVLDEKQRHGFDLFTFTEPPTVQAEIWGVSHEERRTGFRGHVSVTNFTFRGESIDSLQTELQYTNRLLQFFNPRVQHSGQLVSADGLEADFNTQLVYLTNGISNADPAFIARAIGPKIFAAIEPYQFVQPPLAHVDGVIPMRGEEQADLHFDLDGGPFRWWKFILPHIAGHIHWAGARLTLKDVVADFYGGKASGSAAFNFTDRQGTDLEFNVLSTNVLLQSLMADLSARSNHLEGRLAGRLVITKANTLDPHTVSGFGEIDLRDGLIWDIPLFGIFTPVLNGISPGLGNSRANAATCTFIMTTGVLRSNDLEIRSPATRLLYHGTVDVEGNLNARVEAELLRDVWLVGPLVSTVFWPVTKMFEYKVNGTLAEPKSEPVFIVPRIMTLPFHPFRTLRGLLPEEPTSGSTFSPVPP